MLPRIKVGIITPDNQLQQFEHLSNLLNQYGEFEIIIFNNKLVQESDIYYWPIVECLIACFHKDLPINKTRDYVNLRGPYQINNLDKMDILQNRVKIYEKLQEKSITIPQFIQVNREGLAQGEDPPGLQVEENYIKYNNNLLKKPFVEKPLYSQDKNTWIHYPQNLGGGIKRLSDQQDTSNCEILNLGDPALEEQQVAEQQNSIRKNGSYIYENFISSSGIDVRVYMVGARYVHAEATRSSVFQNPLMQNNANEHQKFSILLTKGEKEVARQISSLFGQNLCQFDILRCESDLRSYVIDVNGTVLMQHAPKFYQDSANILRSLIFENCAPHRIHLYPINLPLHNQIYNFQNVFKQKIVQVSEGNSIDDDDNTQSVKEQHTSQKNRKQLRCLVAVVRHGDRTPKQKLKVVVDQKPIICLYYKYCDSKQNQAKLKTPAQLLELLKIIQQMLDDIDKQYSMINNQTKQSSYSQNAFSKGDNHNSAQQIFDQGYLEELLDQRIQFRTIKMVLELGGGFSGINRKVQIKPYKYKFDGPSEISHCMLILKYGGVLTHAGREQAQGLGKSIRQMLLQSTNPQIQDINDGSQTLHKLIQDSGLPPGGHQNQNDLLKVQHNSNSKRQEDTKQELEDTQAQIKQSQGNNQHKQYTITQSKFQMLSGSQNVDKSETGGTQSYHNGNLNNINFQNSNRNNQNSNTNDLNNINNNQVGTTDELIQDDSISSLRKSKHDTDIINSKEKFGYGNIVRDSSINNQGNTSNKRRNADVFTTPSLHTTHQHDIKVYSSDEGRVQCSAAAFTRELFQLEEASLAPILASIIKLDPIMLDYQDQKTSQLKSICKNQIYSTMTYDPSLKRSRMKGRGRISLAGRAPEESSSKTENGHQKNFQSTIQSSSPLFVKAENSDVSIGTYLAPEQTFTQTAYQKSIEYVQGQSPPTHYASLKQQQQRYNSNYGQLMSFGNNILDSDNDSQDLSDLEDLLEQQESQGSDQVVNPSFQFKANLALMGPFALRSESKNDGTDYYTKITQQCQQIQKNATKQDKGGNPLVTQAYGSAKNSYLQTLEQIKLNIGELLKVINKKCQEDPTISKLNIFQNCRDQVEQQGHNKMMKEYNVMQDEPNAWQKQGRYPCNGEKLLMMYWRWRELHKQLYHEEQGWYDVSKIPDIYEGCKYDLIHNQQLGLDFRELFQLSQKIATTVTENEYGVNLDSKLRIGSRISNKLIQKVLGDFDVMQQECFQNAVNEQRGGSERSDNYFNNTSSKTNNCNIQANKNLNLTKQQRQGNLRGPFGSNTLKQKMIQNKEQEFRYKLDTSDLSNLEKAPYHHVRTRIYFTSESHIHSLLNMIRNSKDFTQESIENVGLRNQYTLAQSLLSQQGQHLLDKNQEIDYMSQFQFRLYENVEVAINDPNRFSVQILFSPGANIGLLEDRTQLEQNHLVDPQKTVNIQQGDGISLELFQSLFQNIYDGQDL